MRVRIDVTTQAKSLPWAKVLDPGRGLAYGLLAASNPELGSQLHDHGWGPHKMVPFGHSAPVFPFSRRQKGEYGTGGKGYIEFGSPLPEVSTALIQGLVRRELIDWGGVAMRVLGLQLMEPPDFSSGWARFRTETPVVAKSSQWMAPDGSIGREWLLPTDPEFPAALQQNLERKAETLGVSTDIALQEITWVGPKRSFAVGRGTKPGAAVEVEVSGHPQTLQALWSWGLGQSNAAGFGWIGVQH